VGSSRVSGLLYTPAATLAVLGVGAAAEVDYTAERGRWRVIKDTMTLAGTRQRAPVLTLRRATYGWYILLIDLPTDIDPAEILIRYTGTGSRGTPLRRVQGDQPDGGGLVVMRRW
jgi:hypothetical protein